MQLQVFLEKQKSLNLAFLYQLEIWDTILSLESIAEPEKGENNKIWEGKVHTYGIVPAEMGT